MSIPRNYNLYIRTKITKQNIYLTLNPHKRNLTHRRITYDQDTWLKREKEIFKSNPSVQPDLSGNDYSLQRQLKPDAAVKYTKILHDLKITPTSMIDISDGLSSEALHIASSSNVGIRIHEEKIPVDYTVMNLANEFNLNPIFCALSGGEDYELLFSINQADY